MKTLVLFFVMLLMSISSSMACTVCKKDQPKILQGIIHGAGPESDWDYLIVAVMVAVVVGTLVLSVKYLFKPNESESNHIKRSILNTEIYE